MRDEEGMVDNLQDPHGADNETMDYYLGCCETTNK